MHARRSTFGSSYIALKVYRREVAARGSENHPAARAAFGRWMACRGSPAPSESIGAPASVGYLRELARDSTYASYRGHWNRHQRRHAARQLGAALNKLTIPRKVP
jgi:hypothetical protein